MGNDQRNIPLFVSYPRTGSHWIQAVMEIYFDQPRAPDQGNGISWRPKKPKENYMWLHTHDRNFHVETIHPLGAIFLYRDPVDAIYSLVLVRGGANEKNIRKAAGRFKRLFKKWVLERKARTVLAYEDLLEEPLPHIKRVSKHFKIPWNEVKAQEALNTCTKEAILNKNQNHSKFHNSSFLEPEYAINRIKFRKKWGKLILEDVIDEENEPYLKRYGNTTKEEDEQEND